MLSELSLAQGERYSMMENDKPHILELARDAQLVHPALPLVQAFLANAIDGNQAARYVSHNYTKGGAIDFAGFVQDWKDLARLFYVENPTSKDLSSALKQEVARRDEYYCCLTGVRCRFWRMWAVFPTIPLRAFCIREKRLYDMLGAFTSSSHQNLLQDESTCYQARNCWTLSKETAEACSGGFIKLENISGSQYKISCSNIGGHLPAIYTTQRQFRWKCNLVDYSSRGIEVPDPQLPARIASTVILTAWSKFPAYIRFQTYKLLKVVGLYLYGESIAFMGVQRLPFGMYLKYGPEYHTDRHTWEFNALKLVQNRVSIPVPRPIDLLISSTESFLVTSRIDGELAGVAVDECSDEEMHQVAWDLRLFVDELRAISIGRDSKYAITNTAGGPCFDYRISGEPVGPFRSEKESSESLCLGILPGVTGQPTPECFHDIFHFRLWT